MHTDNFTPKPTADGSFTFFSSQFDEAFHSYSGAKQEAQQKFSQPCQLAQKARSGSLKLLDICYGLGYNSAAALATIWAVNPTCYVELVALEADLSVPQQAIAYQLLNGWNQHVVQLLAELAAIQQVQTPKLNAQLLIGDARKTLQALNKQDFRADAIFLDPFSPPKCPQLWTIEFLELVAKYLAPTGRLATYSCAASVRKALGLAGLKFGPTVGIGRRSPGTVASFSSDVPPLSVQEQEHLHTRAAVPYRDPQLQSSAKEILQRRQQEQQESKLEPTTHWKKRWLEINQRFV